MFGKTKRIHFVGIGGIGMSGIAELLKNQGFEISGSDRKASQRTEYLQSIGIKIHIGHQANLVENADVVVKSSAVNDENIEIVEAHKRKIPVIRRAEMLAEIMRMSYGIGIAGTHGKTTTTSMVGMVLKAANLKPTLIVGGIVKNFGSNNLLGSGEYIVVEADEFDRSFLTLSPIIAGITNIEADHLDCYKDLESIKQAFVQYANKVPFFGSVIACIDDHGVQSIIPNINKHLITYGFSRQADIRAEDIKMKDFQSDYTLVVNNENIGEIHLNVSGAHNVLNSLLAVGVGLELEIPFQAIASGLSEFTGVFRRFEFKGKHNDILFYDDYAHHPTEIEATLKGVKDNTERRIVVIFQPHLFSRTRDFYDEFGRSFYQADVLVVVPIYPAREMPIEGITGELISQAAIKYGHKNVKYVQNNESIISEVIKIIKPGDIVLTMGAGSIYKYGEKLLEEYKKIV